MGPSVREKVWRHTREEYGETQRANWRGVEPHRNRTGPRRAAHFEGLLLPGRQRYFYRLRPRVESHCAGDREWSERACPSLTIVGPFGV